MNTAPLPGWSVTLLSLSEATKYRPWSGVAAALKLLHAAIVRWLEINRASQVPLRVQRVVRLFGHGTTTRLSAEMILPCHVPFASQEAHPPRCVPYGDLFIFVPVLGLIGFEISSTPETTFKSSRHESLQTPERDQALKHFFWIGLKRALASSSKNTHK